MVAWPGRYGSAASAGGSSGPAPQGDGAPEVSQISPDAVSTGSRLTKRLSILFQRLPTLLVDLSSVLNILFLYLLKRECLFCDGFQQFLRVLAG